MLGGLENVFGWIILLGAIAIAVKWASGEISEEKGREIGGFFQGIKDGLTGDLEEKKTNDQGKNK